MAHPYHHARSSVKKHGGVVEDYLAIHSWFDESKKYIADVRHRALRHHAEGIFQCEEKFGVYITNSDGRDVPVRIIGEQHVQEDLGRIPSLNDWLAELPLKSWMNRSRPLSKEN
jgi:hypothetical protein